MVKENVSFSLVFLANAFSFDKLRPFINYLRVKRFGFALVFMDSRRISHLRKQCDDYDGLNEIH